MGIDFFHFSAAVHFPKTDRTVFGRSAENVGILTECRLGDGGLMGAQGVEFLSGVRLPDIDTPGAITTGAEDAIGGNIQRGDPVGMFFDRLAEFSVLAVPKLHRARG